MGSGTTTLVIYMVIFFGIMYFLMIRPQQKQQKARQALLSSLRVKDKILTAGGIYGKITKVKENSVMVQIADKVEVEVAKSGIASVENRTLDASDSKAKKEKSEVIEEPKVLEAERADNADNVTKDA
ncbi:MAG: preprotein translocase subunit YajC [Peptococcaceae bacterium]|nr:preprotein translocase subunit YajC [Peptococcaceae bacterium]